MVGRVCRSTQFLLAAEQSSTASLVVLRSKQKPMAISAIVGSGGKSVWRKDRAEAIVNRRGVIATAKQVGRVNWTLVGT